MDGKIVAWVGDGNNMAATWLQAADILGFTLHVSTPNGYEVDAAAAGVKRGDCFQRLPRPARRVSQRRRRHHRRLDEHGLREPRTPSG